MNSIINKASGAPGSKYLVERNETHASVFFFLL